MSTNATKLPAPGIHRDVSFADYLAWPAISKSRLDLARQSLRHFREFPGMEPTKSLRLGSFLHCGVLEPLAIARRYAVMPPFEVDPNNATDDGRTSQSKTTRWYKQRAAEFISANKGKEIIDEQGYRTLEGVCKSLNRSERATAYLSERGDVEVSLLWQDAETGLMCKARVDLLNSGINDFKSTVDANKFDKAIATYGYHRQGAHYQDGVAATHGGESRPFRLIAAESGAPNGVRAAPLHEEAIEVGRDEIRKTLRLIANAYAADDWPCYDDPSAWFLPHWYGTGGEAIELTVNGETVSL